MHGGEENESSGGQSLFVMGQKMKCKKFTLMILPGNPLNIVVEIIFFHSDGNFELTIYFCSRVIDRVLM